MPVRHSRKTAKRRTRKARRVRLTAAERRQRATRRKFRGDINYVFTTAGFIHLPTREKHFTFDGQTSDIDSMFVYENIVVLCEDTTATTGLRDHVHKTGLFFEHIQEQETAFLEFAFQQFPALRQAVPTKYEAGECHIRYVYGSLHNVKQPHLESHPHLIYLSNTSLRYFTALRKIIHRSVRFELLKFLSLTLSDIGFRPSTDKHTYNGFVVPETPSGFPAGFKLVTFYMDPKTLLELCYVLRKDSWEDTEGLYQRIMIRSKIRAMRTYLATSKRTFVNNVIASLPQQTRFHDADNVTVPASRITKTASYQIELPREFNSIGLIDGQHRVFSYHEGNDKNESVIAAKREKQQLLVTGVVFPQTWGPQERVRFEARLFLEINDKQTRAAGSLKHAIQVIVEPFTATAIAKSVISGMAKKGPLAGLLEDHYFGEGRIKTTSIVSYALRYIVTTDKKARHSLFARWTGNKAKIEQEDMKTRGQYIEYCMKEVNRFIEAYEAELKPEYWTPDRKVSRALSITTLNGLIHCLRLLIGSGKTGDVNYYRKGFKRMRIDFRPGKFKYKSSHWRALGGKMARLFGVRP